MAGGVNSGGSFHSSTALYDTASGTWSATGSLAAARNYHTATLLPNGKVLVAAGSSGAAALNSAELYDSSTGAWTATGSLTTARWIHTATLLADGKLLAAGSYGGSDPSSAEIYDPATGTWTQTGSLTARSLHTATATTGDPKTITVPAADADGDAWTVTGTTPDAHLTVNSTSGKDVTFTPATDYAGTATLGYAVSDGFGGTASGTITLMITDNDAPQVTATPANQTLEATGPGGAVATFSGATATDNVGVVSLTYSQNAGACRRS